MIDTRSDIFKEGQVRVRQLQRMIGDSSSLSGPVLGILVFTSTFSLVTNIIVGITLEILPAAIGVLIIQSIIVGIFVKTDAYDRILARAIVLLYVAFYTFIVVAVEADFNILFTALLGFPQFTVLVMGSREGTFWSSVTLAIIGGGALYYGRENNFEDAALSQIVFVIFQTIIVIMFVYVIDTVARRYAQQLLTEEKSTEESQARYGVLLDTVTEGLVAVDSRGIVQFANKAAVELSGLSKEDLDESVVASTLLLADSKEAILRSADYPVSRVLATQEAVEIDQLSSEKVFMVRKDGTRFPVSMVVSPVQVKDENIGALMVFYDLSEVNATEKAKNEFVSLASHQLRTPLNVTSWYTEKLLSQKKGKLNEHQQTYVNQISQNNNRMISLVRDLLNVSRVDLGRMNIAREDVALVKLIEAQVRKVMPIARTKQIQFTHELPPKEVIMSESDNQIVEAVVENILSNAVKYTPDAGSVTVTMKPIQAGVALNEAAELVAAKDGMLITVTDTGIGIPVSQHEKVFSKLFRADNVRALDVEGAGLGLYVTRSFVSELNGEIWFKSAQGEGTTFFVYLPL